METRTRRLIALLADDLTAELIEQLRRGQMLETELRKQVGSSRQTIARRLGELEAWGIVRGARQSTPGRGAPTTMWRLAGPWVIAFEEAADRYVLQLLEAAIVEQQAAVDAASGWKPRLVDEASD